MILRYLKYPKRESHPLISVIFDLRTVFTMKKIYFLGTCSTCIRIMKDLDTALDGFEKIDIKLQSLTFGEIDQIRNLSGSYEAFFSKRAVKYKALKDKSLQESDYRKLIQEESTFLTRPVFIVDGQIFIGNSPTNILALKVHLGRG